MGCALCYVMCNIEYFLLLYNAVLHITFFSLNAHQVTLSVGPAKLAGNLQILTFYVVRYRLHVILLVWNFIFYKKDCFSVQVYE